MSHSESPQRPLTLQEQLRAKREAWDEHAKQHSCDHASTDTRKRAVQGGGWQLVKQCLTCGARLGGAIRQAGVSMADVPDFDEGLLLQHERARDKSAAHIQQAFTRERWLQSYGPYLSSPEWADKRQRVLARARWVCEGCGERPPTQVHHLTYEHVGAEFLFELVALCEPCHDRIHDVEGEG